MGIVTGLKNLNKALDKSQTNSGDGSKGRWLKIEDGESIKVRFLQELDPDSPHYDQKMGLTIVATEHTNPKDYRRKAICTMEDEDKCWGCEQHKKNYKAGWKAKSRLYTNVLVMDEKEDPYVAILSQGISGKTITPTLVEYASEMGSITNLVWRIKRNGTKTDTSYTIIPLAKDETTFDASGLELYDLQSTALRTVPYAEQEAFYNGEGSTDDEESSTSESSSSVDW